MRPVSLCSPKEMEFPHYKRGKWQMQAGPRGPLPGTHIPQKVLLLVEGQDRLTQGVVCLQTLADGWLRIIRPVLHLSTAQDSPHHCFHGAVKPHDYVGGPAHLGSNQQDRVRVLAQIAKRP